MEKIERLHSMCMNIGLRILKTDFTEDIKSRDRLEFVVEHDTLYDNFRGFVGAKGFISYLCFANKSKPALISPSNPHSVSNMNIYLKNNNIQCVIAEENYLNSKTKIKCICVCGNIFYSRWNTIRCSGKTSCDRCGGELGAKNKRKTSILKNGSMKDLLFREYGNRWEEYWDFSKNNLLPENISSTSNSRIYLICAKKNYHFYSTTTDTFKQGVRCGYCTGKRLNIKDTIGEIKPQIVKLWSEKNSYSPFELFYNSPTKVWIKCPEGVHEDSYKEVRDIYRRNSGCLKCNYSSNRGSGNWKWKGGVSDLRSFLRDKISDWKRRTIEEYDFKCDVTGVNRDFEIHHLKSFSDIFYSFIEMEGIEIKSIGSYTEEAKRDIERRFVKYHDSFGLGVLMSKEVHREFHRIYGNSPTVDNYKHFKSGYVNNK